MTDTPGNPKDPETKRKADEATSQPQPKEAHQHARPFQDNEGKAPIKAADKTSQQPPKK